MQWGEARKHLTTYKGQTSYYTINEEVFKPNGFEIISASEPVPLLKSTKPKTCDQIFSSWLDIALKYNPPSSPPESIPLELIPEFTMNGHAVLTKGYHNDMAKPMPKTWNQIPAWLNLDPLTLSSYGVGGISVLHSIKYMNVTGMNGIVIGSVDPWVEVIALQSGANSLLTVEYQSTTILGESRVKWIHPYEYAKNWKEQKQFDFAVSFSSIEHSGLQRYGDPRDPIGDIREVQKVWCMLKKGGIFFLGLPRGQDQLVYNAHRIYGRIRLAMIFYG
ncbi:hypothetical protein WR25_20011 [Diploscapter pachys]|uniref:Methyltransferase type 11 domain-containing protein n=1 Tax=Diploscapter pachys TaxID=2018661 RepID=A0A2A2LAS9_9BILA|nr:hypothetical protein WR25_20011 [Diploscapter pachys]